MRVTRRAVGSEAEDGAAVDAPGVRRLSGLFGGWRCHHGNGQGPRYAIEAGQD